jgi:hypothetical protein
VTRRRDARPHSGPACDEVSTRSLTSWRTFPGARTHPLSTKPERLETWLQADPTGHSQIESTGR